MCRTGRHAARFLRPRRSQWHTRTHARVRLSWDRQVVGGERAAEGAGAAAWAVRVGKIRPVQTRHPIRHSRTSFSGTRSPDLGPERDRAWPVAGLPARGARGDDLSKRPVVRIELILNDQSLVWSRVRPDATVLRVGSLELDLLRRTAKRGNRPIDLRPREFQLLGYMMRRSDELLTRETLLKEVWQYKFVPETNLVDVHMGKLRRKVDGSYRGRIDVTGTSLETKDTHSL